MDILPIYNNVAKTFNTVSGKEELITSVNNFLKCSPGDALLLIDVYNPLLKMINKYINTSSLSELKFTINKFLEENFSDDYKGCYIKPMQSRLDVSIDFTYFSITLQV